MAKYNKSYAKKNVYMTIKCNVHLSFTHWQRKKENLTNAKFS